MPHSVLVERISFLAKERRISIQKLQRDLKLGPRALWSWNKSSPLVKHLIPIAKYFNVSLDFLCGLDDSPCITKYPLSTQKLLYYIYTRNLSESQASILLEYVEILEHFSPSDCKKIPDEARLVQNDISET